jgi:hypothetical protein
MLAGIPEFREVDFSHPKLDHTDFESVEPARKQKSPLLWLALLLSSLLHLSLLFVAFSSNQPRPKQAPTQTLHIDLLHAPLKTSDAEPKLMAKETVESQTDAKATKDVIIPSVSEPVIATTEKPRETQRQARLVIESLSPQELTAIVESHNTQADYRRESAIGKNVFHPGLRAQLNAEADKPILARVEDAGLTTHLDPSGATVLMLDNGGCLRSPPTEIGEAKNWYVSMTPCPGKNESERIMERVEQSINGKLKFNNND